MKHKKTVLALLAVSISGLLLLSLLTCLGCPVTLVRNTTLDFPLELPLREVLYYASLAPNAHNAQMWRVEVFPAEKRLHVLLDKSRFLPQVDPLAVESLLSVGAFLENMRRGFSAYGYKADFRLLDQPDDDGCIAVVSYSGGTVELTDRDELTLMEKRHSDKRNFRPVEIPGEALRGLTEKYAPQLRYYPKGSAHCDDLAQAAVSAMATQCSNPAKREELAEWLRFSNAETRERMDGLPAEQLGLEGVMKFIYYAFVDREAALGDKFARQSVELVRGQAENCSGFFVLLGADDASDSRGLLETGMAFASFWLDATRLGISLQPMSQILEEEPFSTEIPAKLGLDGTPRIILRAGIVDGYGSNRKIRRDLSRFVAQGSDDGKE